MTDTNSQKSFEQAANEDDQQGIFSEFFMFMKDNAKWWLTPFLVVFFLLAVLVVLGSTGAAPFIYTLF